MYTTETTELKTAFAALMGVDHEMLECGDYSTREYYEGCCGYTWKSAAASIFVERMRFECDEGGEDTVEFNWDVRLMGMTWREDVEVETIDEMMDAIRVALCEARDMIPYAGERRL